MRQRARRVLAISCLTFLGFGVITGSWGVLLPDLAAKSASDLASAGFIFTALFFGALVSETMVGLLTDRFGHGIIITGGLLLLGAGIAGVAASRTLALTLACEAVTGLGVGAIEVGVQTLVAAAFAARSVAALNLLNVFFGAGAFLGPVLAGLVERRWQNTLPLLWATSAFFVAQVPFFASLALDRPTSAAPRRHSPDRAVLRMRLLWPLGALLLLYVGLETGIGGWTATYVARTAHVGMSTAALVAASFWLALTMGRVLAVMVARKLTAPTLVAASLVGAVAGGVLLVMSAGRLGLTIAAVIVLGTSFGPIFPTVLAMVAHLAAEHAGKATGVVVALGSVGGSLLPPAQGLLLVDHGLVASALLVLGAALAMLGLFVSTRVPAGNALAGWASTR